MKTAFFATCGAALMLALAGCQDEAPGNVGGTGAGTDESASGNVLAGEATASLSAAARAAASDEGPLPHKLPLYPGARDIIAQTDGQVVRFASDDAPETIAAFYGEAMKARFGDATVTGMAGFYTASMLKPGGPQMQIVARTENGRTVVSIGSN